MKITIDAWYPEEVVIAARAMTEILEFRRNVGNLSSAYPDGPQALSDADRKEALRIERDALDGKMEPVAEQPIEVEDVKPLVALYVKKHSVEDLKAMLRSEFGVARVTEVPSEKAAQLIGKLKEGLA